MIKEFIPPKGITIISGYTREGFLSYVAIYELLRDNNIQVKFPKSHPFRKGDKVTLHLDNRTGVDQYDEDLRVNRCSYRGLVYSHSGDHLKIRPEEYQMFHSTRVVDQYQSENYKAHKLGKEVPLQPASVTGAQMDWNPLERENKLGVLLTRMQDRPHSTLMAFLSNKQDDIFFITFPATFKSQLLHRDPRCHFAIDHRGEYNFERAVDWNFTIIEAEARLVNKKSTAFKEIQYSFIQKNPWESAFFSDPQVEMFHLAPQRLIIPQ